MSAMVWAVNCHGASGGPGRRDDARAVDEVRRNAGAVVGDRLQSGEADVIENAAQECADAIRLRQRRAR
jgi:hypothetical protein